MNAVTTGGIPRAPRQAPLPLSFAQERMWLLHRLDPASPAYNLPLALRITGPLDAGALGRALTEVVTRHEVLRTTFDTPDGVPVQLVHDPAPVPLPAHDIGGSGTPMIDAGRVVDEQAGRPFDLAAGPPLRPLLIRLGDHEHVLSLVLHHIVSDEWSARVLREELSTLYAAFRDGRPSPLPPLPTQYADFAAWQRRELAGGRLDRLMAHWRQRLAGLPPLDLPVDRPRPVARMGAGGVVEFEVPAALTARLREAGRRAGATLFMTLLAAWQVLLFRQTGAADLAVGTSVIGRDRPELEPLIGCFLNTLVLRSRIPPDAPFDRLLTEVRATTLDAYAHQELPFEKLVEGLEPRRDLSRHPLFQVMFSYQDAPSAGEPELAGVRYCAFPTPTTRARFDLALSLTGDPTGLTAALEYSAELFDRSTVQRWADQYGVLLAGVAADPGCRVDRLPLLPAGERNRVIGWGRGASGGPAGGASDGLLAQRVAARAAARPQALAVIAEDGRLTYRELDAAATRLAHQLRVAGAGPETLVGLLLERGAAFVTAMLACWRAGAGYLPLDPADPPARLRRLLTDAGAGLVITTGDLDAALGAPWLRFVRLDEDAGPVNDQSDAPPLPRPLPDNVAYLMYTSGSTGTPKGVVITHGGLASLAEAMRRGFLVTESDRFLQFASSSFDASVAEIAVALTAGATLVVATPAARRASTVLVDEIRRHRVDGAILPPALLAVLQPRDLAGLRTVITAGERLPAAVAARWAGSVRLLNAYGPTETTVCVTVTADRLGAGEPPIGRPVRGVTCYLLDRGGQLVPAGTPGELFVGGAGVARGYAGRPDLTAERFVPDPFAADGSRLYRTGDLTRWRPDGQLEFRGRVDDQLTVRGHRVEPAEVEAALLANPAVRAAAVSTCTDRDGTALLAAWVVPGGPDPGPDQVPDPAALRQDLASRLPAHLVPDRIMIIDELPLTASGKLDRTALPAPSCEPPGANSGEPPRTPTEQALARIWAEVLGVAEVGRTGDFFLLGGHSLLAVQVAARIEQAMGIALDVRLLFERPRLADFAAAIDAARPTAVIGPGQGIPRRAAGTPAPLSFVQQRLWFLHQLDPASTAYHAQLALRLSGALDVAALRGAFTEIVARHEVLRTTFAAPDGVPVQIVHPPAPVPFTVEDLSAGPDPLCRARDVLAAEASRPYDLERGPLLRVRLLRLAAEDHVLAVGMHHVVADEWSLGVLTRELSILYGALRDGLPSPLLPLPVQYADYAAWQRDALSAERMVGQLAYWRSQLAGLSPLDLPTDRPYPPVRAEAGGWVRFDVPPEAAGALAGCAHDEHATMFMAVLAGFVALLSRYCGQDDIAVGTPVAGRTRVETEPMIGLFLNTVVLRTRLAGDPTYRELLATVRDVALDAYAHAELPFEQLVDELAPQRDRGRHPLFHVVLNYLDEDEPTGAGPAGLAGLAGLDARDLDPPETAAKFDLRLVVQARNGGLHADLQYRRDLFDAATAERLAGSLRTLLVAAAADPDRPVSRLPLLASGEAPWRPAVAPVDTVALPAPVDTVALPTAVARHAAATPDAPAVSDPDGCRSYAELDAAADRLAHRLRAAGVGTDTVVALALAHGVELMTAVLAVWRAGGAYLALNPDDPPRRQLAQLTASGAALLVTTEAVADSMPAVPMARLVLDDHDTTDEDATGDTTGAPPGRQPHPDGLAYLVFTSGSTGEPKPVGVTHRNLAGYAAAITRRIGAPPGRYTLAQPLSVDLGLTAVALALAGGGELRLVEPALARDPVALATALAGHRPDCLKLTPTHLGLLLAGPDPVTALPSTALILGGEPTDPRLLAALAGAGYTGELHNHYGPTEATVGALTFRAARLDPAARFPLGTPLPGVSCHILDRHGQPVPAGVPGELYLGGVGVARGYLSRPELTVERFLPDPFTGDGARLYRTGDLVRGHPDGTVSFLRRCDDQLILHGNRIEPAEIEALLAGHPAIAAAAVAARPDPGPAGGRRLVAWFVPADPDPQGVESAPTPADLRRYLAGRLPAALVPAVFAAVDTLPLTPAGKPDRAALPDPEPATAQRPAWREPATDTERVVAAIWAELLAVDAVGRNDDFFDLGGHSLVAAQVVTRVRAALEIELPLAALFDHPTLEGVCAVVDTLRWVVDGARPAEVDGATGYEEVTL
jgi:amino acid adenylation domain-containing protein